MIELKLCPFCGSEDVGTVLPYAVYCFSCRAAGPHTSTEARAIEKWNDRKGKAHEILGRVCTYLLLLSDFALPASLWNEMLDEIPEQEREMKGREAGK